LAAGTIVLNLDKNGAALDATFVSRLFSPTYQFRVIVLARGADVAWDALGPRFAKRLKQVWLEPLSGRSQAIHRLLDRRFEELQSALRVSSLTPENADALRNYRWPENFASLRQAAEWLIAVEREDSLRQAAMALDVKPNTFHHWFADMVGLTLPLLA